LQPFAKRIIAMSKVIKIKKGKYIILVGAAALKTAPRSVSSTFAVKPTDFRNLVPKLVVKAGEEVKAGDVLFYDKNNPDIQFTSPVSGEVAEIVRGDRRAVLEVRVLADTNTEYKSFDTPSTGDADAAKKLLLESGLWPCITQRPYGVIANPADSPKAIHVSAFDSAPLAADYNYTLADDADAFQRGIDVLNSLTSGKVHLNCDAKTQASGMFSQINGVETTLFQGAHPAGLVGVQIHHIDPINKGDIAWTVSAQHVVFIGRLFATGKLDLSQKVAIAGSDVKDPQYVETVAGVNIEAITKDNISGDNSRVISGNVLSGTSVGANGYLGFFDTCVSIIPEGDDYEFMGWLFPSYARPTNSNSLPISKFLKKSFVANTNMHGEERAFVVSGQYEAVLPMDVLPVHLLKAILAQDLEAMENLGIYEVIGEDLALCEFVCTSKINVQEILDNGLTLMESEG
jgi:Na+-transporting NADH:ubiquinone oxidoreductase subunit A